MSETAKAAPGQPLVGVTEIKGFVTQALASVEIPAEDATQVAALMAEAGARGGNAHGVFRLPQYVDQIQSGGINVRPNIQILSGRAGAALIDGDHARGHLVMQRATELAIDKARRRGIGWVGKQHTNSIFTKVPA
jgi:L-2-hydroxycarboxylate dehydrogenase (NAD+)